jgi:antiviral helicase SLH1
MAHDECLEDPQLGSKRQGLTQTAGRRLEEIGMIKFDQIESTLTITDLGRIAAKYYLKHETVEIFSE